MGNGIRGCRSACKILLISFLSFDFDFALLFSHGCLSSRRAVAVGGHATGAGDKFCPFVTHRTLGKFDSRFVHTPQGRREN